MTHTLHRQIQDLTAHNDYVILVMPARGINNNESLLEKYSNFLRIFARHNPANMGGMGLGEFPAVAAEEMIVNLYQDLPMIHGVFSTREDLVGALQEIKEQDMGLSIIVTGLAGDVNCCLKDAGLSRHSINYSLGVWGDKSRLPDQKILEITSMCGHAMISFGLVQKMVADIKRGTKTVEQAARELSKPCVCGIFNIEKAKTILSDFIE